MTPATFVTIGTWNPCGWISISASDLEAVLVNQPFFNQLQGAFFALFAN
jgi:hypothetical protein